MGLFDFNLLKKLSFSSFFKYEKRSKVLIKNTYQTNNFISSSQVANDIIKRLSQYRQNNLINIISKAETNIKGTNIKSPESEWLGPFIDYSKDISNEKLQNIWSEILKGKMNNKNTSIRTLSVLRNMHTSEAHLANQFLNYKIGDFIYYEEGKMPSNFPIYSKISLLLEIGLIQARGVFTIIERSENILSKPMIFPFFAPNRGYLGHYCGYSLFFDFPPNETTIHIPSIVLSEAGKEISQFVEQQVDNEYLSYVSKFLKSKNLQLKRIKQPKFFTVKDLKSPPPVENIN